MNIEILSRAKEYVKDTTDSIIANAKKRNGVGRIIYLCQQVSNLQSRVHSTIPKYNYDLKGKINNAVQTDTEIYLTEKDLEPAFKSFKEEFTKYEELISVKDSTNDSESIFDSVLYPGEIVSIAKKHSLKSIDEITMPQIVEGLLCDAMLLRDLEITLEDEVLATAMTEDDFEKIAEEYQGRFLWEKKGEALAYLFYELANKDWLRYPSPQINTSDAKKAALIIAHFNITTRKRSLGNTIRPNTMKDYLDKAKHNTIPEIIIKKAPL